MHFQSWVVMLQTVHQARIEQANGSGRAVSEERVLPDHKASLKEKDAELQVMITITTIIMIIIINLLSSS